MRLEERLSTWSMRVRFGGAALVLAVIAATGMHGVAQAAPPPPSISIGDAGVVEGAFGTRRAIFNIVLSAPPKAKASVHFATSDGSAQAGSDYIAASGKLSFDPGATSAVIAVKAKGDRDAEPDQDFSVTLTNPAGLVIDDATAEGSIADDDPSTGQIATLGWTSRTQVYGGKVALKIPVTLAKPAGSQVSLDLSASCHPVGGCVHLPGPTTTVRAGSTGRNLRVLVDPSVASHGTVGITLAGGDVPVDSKEVLSAWRSVAAGTGLVINEVDYDNVGHDTNEFVEIRNDGGAAASLDGLALVLVNGRDDTEYRRVGLTGTLPAGGYLVVADATVDVAPGAMVVRFGSSHDNVQNGAPDGVALVDTDTHKIIDALSYEGGITQAHLVGFPSPVSLVEGTATGVADSNTNPGSVARIPNGSDTDDAHKDWRAVANPTPGSANVM